MKVWKFIVPRAANRVSTVTMPEGACIVAFRAQQDGEGRDVPTIWAVINVVEGDQKHIKTERRTFILVETGWPLPEEGHWKYVGTEMFLGGAYVLHLFEDTVVHGLTWQDAAKMMGVQSQ